jgi:hypothetical protein
MRTNKQTTSEREREREEEKRRASKQEIKIPKAEEEEEEAEKSNSREGGGVKGWNRPNANNKIKKRDNMEKHSDMAGRLAFILIPREMRLSLTISSSIVLSLCLSLYVYVSLWRSVCFCARPAGHCSGTKRKLVKVEPVLVSVPSVLVMHENGRGEFGRFTQLQKHQRSIERQSVCVVML